MNRRRFVFSWGRKLFFGLSFPLSLFISLLYLKSFVLPKTLIETVYFAMSWVGHFGLFNVLTYFVLFVPVVFIFPTYYVSRFWSVFLILLLNAFIAADALSFSNYGLHLDSYFSKLLLDEGFHHLVGSNIFFAVAGFGVLVFSSLIWLRGEMIWRHMQGRFSNPVSEWYLAVIFLCFFLGKTIYHFGPIHSSLAEVFPLDFNLHRPEKILSSNKRWYYPSADLSCGGKLNPNIVIVTISEWNNLQVTPETMPHFYHIKSHSHAFLNHQNVADNFESGYFSLLYSLPAQYKETLKDEVPALKSEMIKRNYDIAEFGAPQSSDESTLSELSKWFINRSGGENKPFYLSVRFNDHPTNIDKHLKMIVGKLQSEGLLGNTNVIFTSAYSGTTSNLLPLYWSTPERKFKEFNNLTTPYDVMPTLMENFWSCKKAFKAASIGESLESDEQDWFLLSTTEGFGISDKKTNGVTFIRQSKIEDIGPGARKKLIFEALKKLNTFNKPR